MTIAILRTDRRDGQRIPRPFNRACSPAEAAEMLHALPLIRNAWPKTTEAALESCIVRNLDTETPMSCAGVDFYFFREA